MKPALFVFIRQLRRCSLKLSLEYFAGCFGFAALASINSLIKLLVSDILNLNLLRVSSDVSAYLASEFSCIYHLLHRKRKHCALSSLQQNFSYMNIPCFFGSHCRYTLILLYSRGWTKTHLLLLGGRYVSMLGVSLSLLFYNEAAWQRKDCNNTNMKYGNNGGRREINLTRKHKKRADRRSHHCKNVKLEKA